MEEQKIITLEEFKEILTNMSDEGVTMREDGEFSFGFNWLDFVKKRMTTEIIGMHKDNLKNLYDQININLEGKSVFDIGCGSGLSSISFALLGCKHIVSMDIDSYSVQATNYTKDMFWKGNTRTTWEIKQHSIMEDSIVPEQSFDIVYSWGVLHHTGDMWRAIRNSVKFVKPGGLFHVALYRSGAKLTKSLEEKYRFKLADKETKIKMLYDRAGQKIFNVKKGRGMNKFHDALDWLGGLPYEVCDPEVLFGWLKSQYNFDVLFFADRNAGGNFTAILRRS
jgi:2-polyprenyl-6-hydroxyphenyl methylase/3-demethylubiquinone-9 3-methyltransferase